MKNPQKFRFANCGLDFEMPFGKHKNQTLKTIVEIDPSYMQWLMTEYIIHVETGSKASKYIFTRLGDWKRHKYDWCYGFSDWDYPDTDTFFG